MPDTVSIAELCWNAQNACLMTGLQPVQWRWSWAAWRQFRDELAPYMQACHFDANPELPPGCLGVYEGLPIYRMETAAFSHPAVACIGMPGKPPGF